MKYSFVISLTLLFALTGCTPQPITQETTAPKVQAVASFYPLAFMTEKIGGDKVDVINLSGNRDVHDYKPSPQDIVQIQKSDIFIFQGSGLELWTDGMIEEIKEKNISVLEVSEHLTLHKSDEHNDEKHEEDHDEHVEEHTEDHADEHDEHEEEEHEEEEHEDDHHQHGEYDPHTWLDPILAQDMIAEITEHLSEISPDNAKHFETNAQVLTNRFQELDTAYQTTLASCQLDEVISSHDAFGYIAERYNFIVHAITGLNPNDEPSLKLLAQLKENTQETVQYILAETGNTARFSKTLADEMNIEILPINPLGKGTLDPQKDFFDIQKENLQSFKTALQCQ